MSFELVLEETESEALFLETLLMKGTQQAGVSCEEEGIATIVARILDENGRLLVEGGPFECEAHEGVVDGVPPGSNRVLVVDANDEYGTTIFRGRAGGLGIVAGMTTNAGIIALQRLNNAPVADAGPDQTAYIGETVTLDGSGSSDMDGNALTYSWSLTAPEGSNASLSDATAVRPTFVMDVAGTYVAQLIVSDGYLSSDPYTIIINWENSRPVANAGPDQTAYIGQTVTLDGSRSSDVDGDRLTYSWMLIYVPEGSNAVLSVPTIMNPTFILDRRGTYVAELTVHDGFLRSEPDRVIINWENSRPVANAGPDQTRLVGETVTLDHRFSRRF
ncbi:MAG: hypothetical protein JW836_14760 [Deltaproteobacteria bacterium]|nr:hypothetical protein [Deltaproteobacteria bacterium]